MTLATLVAVYLIGGLTFIPLLLAAVLVPAWLFLPRIDLPKSDVAKSKKDTKEDARDRQKTPEDASKERESHTSADGTSAASATFAVLRSYHFPSANAAFNARSLGSSNGVAAVSASTGAVDGRDAEATGNSSSESVYQSMYRSVFDRGRNNSNITSSVLENSGDATSEVGRVRRKAAVTASVFYIVLRHGHLMLYDSPAQMEVRHVISLEHHSISLTDGEQDEHTLPEADLFIKRTAIVLSPMQSSSLNGNSPGRRLSASSQPPNPFFLFCSNCSEKEDFFHALLSTRASPPAPQPIAPEDVIKLQSTLHSTSLTPETRAFNALVGRIFLSVHRTPFLENLVRSKIEKKIARVQKPAFIAALSVKTISLGDSAPVLSQPRLKDINISGDMTLSFDVRYTGALQVVIAALAKLDLGSRFKARSVDLLLSTSFQRLSGKMLVKIKAPPSNRIWFCFETVPDMEIKIEPVVSTRQISYNFILRAIEERIRAVMGETLVQPNWDDVPFFDTRRQRTRGGIWRDEGRPDDEDQSHAILGTASQRDAAATAPSTVLNTNEKSMSMPSLASAAAEAASASSTASSRPDPSTTYPLASGTSTSADPSNNLRLRSAASLPLQHPSSIDTERQSPPIPSKPLRSPSFIAPPPSMPSVAVDDASGLRVRADDAGLQAKKWRSRASLQGTGRKEAVDAVREMRDRSLAAAPPIYGEPALRAREQEPPDDESDDNLRPGSSEKTHPRFGFGASSRTDSQRSLADSTTTTTSRQQQRKNLLAATAAATTAARNWSWNAIANRTGAGGGTNRPVSSLSSASNSQTSLPPEQPMGRGQPLPPPGTPLPGPQKGLFAGLSAVGAKASLKRKPVLPPRKATTLPPHDSISAVPSPAVAEGADGKRTHLARQESSGDDSHSQHHDADLAEEEFGPWSENSGTVTRADAVDSEQPLQCAHDGEAPVSTVDPDVGDEPNSRPSSAPIAAGMDKMPPPLPPRRPRKSVTPSPTRAESDGRLGSLSDLGHESIVSAGIGDNGGSAVGEHDHVPPADDDASETSAAPYAMMDDGVDVARVHGGLDSEPLPKSQDVSDLAAANSGEADAGMKPSAPSSAELEHEGNEAADSASSEIVRPQPARVSSWEDN